MRKGRAATQRLRKKIQADYAFACAVAAGNGLEPPPRPKFNLWTPGQMVKSGNRKYVIGPRGEFRRVAE
jgi:hypothetical protein